MSSEIVPVLDEIETSSADNGEDSSNEASSVEEGEGSSNPNVREAIQPLNFLDSDSDSDSELDLDLYTDAGEMRSEIVPVLDEIETSSVDNGEDSSNEASSVEEGEGSSNSNLREAIQPLKFLDSDLELDLDLYTDAGEAMNPEVTVDLIGGDYHTSQFLASEKGHKYVKQFNPVLESVKPLFKKIKEPSVLLLRGCELLLQSDFPFQKFKALTALEISGISHLTTIPEKTISEMTQLQSLELSNLPISHLPHDFFSNIANLRSLVLRGCSNLHALPEPPQLSELECLDLSDLPIETLPLGFISSRLRFLVLRGCSQLCSIPSSEDLFQLEFLDLSHCIALQTLEPIEDGVRVLDLSYTALGRTELLCTFSSLTHLFLRGAKVCNLKKLEYESTCPLRVCDLSGAQNLQGVNMLKYALCLEALDLSRTDIKSIYNILSYLTSLRTLILRDCTRLVKLPAVKRLQQLMVLDISGCGILADLPKDLRDLRNLKELNLSRCSGLKELREGLFDEMSCLEKLDLSKTNIKHLPSIANLTNLQTLNLAQTSVQNAPDLSKLINLNLVGLSGMGNEQETQIGWGGNIHPSHMLEKISNANELHLVSTFFSRGSIFDQFRYKFRRFNNSISDLEKNFKPSSSSYRTVTANTQDFEKVFRRLRADLQYILHSIDLLESSPNCMSSEELLHELVCFEYSYREDCFIQLRSILQMVVKLKLLVPPPPKRVKAEEEEKMKKKNKNKNKKKPLLINDDYEEGPYAYKLYLEETERRLTIPYESLTNIERNCLLYFLGFPTLIRETKLIKESLLIHLWYGEGLFDPVLDAYPTKNPQPTPKKDLYQFGPNSNPERINVNQQVSTTKRVEIPNTVEETGRQILHVLQEKGFIKIHEGKKWHMDHAVYSFVKDRAGAEHFFDFNKFGKLTPHITASKRACLLKSEDYCLSSCQLWLNYATSSEKQEKFKTIQTLLYVDELVVDIKTEWFSKMRNLSVLHLVNLCSRKEEQISIVNLKFLEELKNMKQLRLLSLESFSVIQKLPDSVCKLTDLRILKLRYCTNLVELPAGIGSLRNLIYLDLTQCHLLSALPKGLSLLSKLEVLKGFMITYNICGRQHRKACTLRELLKLENLRKVNIVVNKDKFPSSEDLQVFKEMKNLCNLSITWRKNYYQDEESQQEALRHSRWQKLKCWDQRKLENGTEEELHTTTSNCWGNNLKKLVLCGLSSEIAPNWLHPSELQQLEKLYMAGGSLKSLLLEDSSANEWKVKTLHLKYLSSLDMDWPILKAIFPYMTSFWKLECPYIRNFTGKWDKWTVESEEGSE